MSTFQVDLSATPALINAGDSFVLAWDIKGGVGPLSVVLDNGIGPVAGGNGSMSIALSTATQYNVTVTDRLGNIVTSSINVLVRVTVTTYYNGLNAIYQEQGPGFTDPYVTYRTGVDSNVNLAIYCGQLPGAVARDSFTNGIWTGKIVPRYTEIYTLYLDAGTAGNYCNGNIDLGHAFLSVNGVTLINYGSVGAGFNHAGLVPGTPIALVAGVPVTVSINRSSDNEDYVLGFLWQSASQTRETVPSSQLWYQDPSTVTTTYSPIVAGLGVDASTIYAGQSTTLRWTSTNATAASFDHGIGSVSTTGSQAVSPTTSTTYTETLTSPNCTTITRQVTITVLPLPAPAEVGAFNACLSSIRVVWDEVAAATAYRVLRSTVAGGPYVQIGPDVVGTTLLDTPSGGAPLPWVPYYYVVQSVCGSQVSANSSEATATASTTVGQVTGLTVTAAAGHLLIGWSPVDHATSYSLYRGISADSLALIGSNLTGLSILDAVTSDQVYFYAVVAAGVCGQGSQSAIVTGTALSPATAAQDAQETPAQSLTGLEPSDLFTTAGEQSSTWSTMATPPNAWS